MSVHHIYIDDTISQVSSVSLECALAQLPDWRREAALRFRHEQGRRECACSYLLLCRALREVYGIHTQPTFVIGEHGKPSLAEFPHIHFNISHCKCAVACVVADHPVGVDVERIGRYNEALARHVLNDAELAATLQAPSPATQFARYWTQKEAVVKLTGRGIDDNLPDILMRLAAQVDLYTEAHEEKGYVVSVAEASREPTSR